MARGEFELIDDLARLVGAAPDGIGIGDDAATWHVSDGSVAVGTTDMLVEGIHFRLDWITPRDLGWKALAANLSDLAAMGARPGRALVSIALLADQAPLAVEMYEGMVELARQTGTYIVGGDVVRTSGPLVVNVALIGEADPAHLLCRDAARPGDLVALTGHAGGSAAGLAVLSGDGARPVPDAPTPGDDTNCRAVVAAHNRPWPRLQAGQSLAAAGVNCAIDVSDGVASELWHVARASGVAIEVDVEALPLHPAAVAIFGEDRAREFAISGGEDYELLFTFAPAIQPQLVAAIGPDCGLTVIGRVTATAPGGSVVLNSRRGVLDPRDLGYVAF